MELELEFLGSHKGYYYLKSKRTKKEIKSKKLVTNDLIEVVPLDTWRLFFPKKNKAGEVYGVDWVAAKSHIIEEIGTKKYSPEQSDWDNDVDLYKDLTDYINHEPWTVKDKPFSKRYLVYEPELGKKMPLLLADPSMGVCKRCGMESVADVVVNETADRLCQINEGYSYFDFDKSMKAARYWRARTTPIEEPKPLLMRGVDGYCYNRADFNYTPGVNPDDHPIIGQVFRSEQNVDAVKAFIGSIFDPDADISQSLVIHDPDGKRGKSAIMRGIGLCIGDAMTSSTSPKEGEMQFFNAQFENKRLGIIPDANSLDFMQDQHFKMLTGGDLIPINNKYGQKYTKRLSCKILISTNAKSKTKGQLCDVRRMIYYELPPIVDIIDKFELLFYEARDVILSHCIDTYNRVTKGAHCEIPTDNSLLDDVIEQNTIDEQVFFDKYFVLQASGRTSNTTMKNCIDECLGLYSPPRHKSKFKKDLEIYMRRVFKIQNEPYTLRNKSVRGYKGFHLAPGHGRLCCTHSTQQNQASLDDQIRAAEDNLVLLKEMKLAECKRKEEADEIKAGRFVIGNFEHPKI